jgi:hypothetical protein
LAIWRSEQDQWVRRDGGQLSAMFDRRDRVGERGFEKSVFVHWDDLTHVRLRIGMDPYVL